MELILTQHSNLIHGLRRLRPSVKIEEIKHFLDNLLQFIKNQIYTNKNSDGLDVLTIVSDDLASIHTLRLFDHPVIINHPIFIYLGRTLEMLLTKSNHCQSIPMNKQEENCFYSISYLIVQLCWYRNGPMESFYGSISDKIPPVTWKMNVRDETIGPNSRKSNPIAGKPNVKVSSLPPTAPKSRPMEQREIDITKIIHRKNFPERILPSSNPTITKFSPLPTDLPPKKYQDVFLTKSFLEKLARAIDDLSQRDYAPYHIKYKVTDRFVRLCSKLNIFDNLLDPIINCLRSKFYHQAFTTINSEQCSLNPKQLFFIYQCPRFIMQNECQIPTVLCQAMIEVTKPIIDLALPTNEIARHTLHYHLQFLNHLTLTSTGRRIFIQSPMINQMIEILRSDAFDGNGKELFNPDVGIIANALMFLYNLAYEKEIFSMLKQKNLNEIFSKYQSLEDHSIKFALTTLESILNGDRINSENEPIRLQKDYTEYMRKTIIQSKEILVLRASKDSQKRDDGKKHMVLTHSFVEKLIRDIENLPTDENQSNKSAFRNASRRVRVCTTQETKEVQLLLDTILKCLDSNVYLDVFEKIELSQSRDASGAVSSSRNLAEKHLFYMRECPEFLFRHDYKQYSAIADSLGKKMLSYTTTIFKQHLPAVFSEQSREDRSSRRAPESDESARMEALSYHIKMLTHFTQTPATRREFFGTSIVDQVLSIVQDKALSDEEKSMPNAKIMVVGRALIFLYNLAAEKEIASKLLKANMMDICLKLRSFKDKIIHFASQILLIMLDNSTYKNLNKPDLLSRTSIEYIDRSVSEPKQLYQGVKLDGLLKNLNIITQDSSFVGYFVAEKASILTITKCVYGNHPDNAETKLTIRIRRTAIDIIWKLSGYGPIVNKKLKEDNKFIDQLLALSNETSNKTKEVVEAIIWRLGSAETVRLEIANRQEKQTDDEQLPTDDQWDETIPYDLLISFSSNVTDKILTLKIYNRLVKKGYRVYIKGPSKNRLALMHEAIDKRKPILACLSKSYRSSKICMAEIEYAQQNSSPIIPIIVQPKYQIQGWLKHILSGKNPLDFTDKKFDENLMSLSVEIEKLKSSD